MSNSQGPGIQSTAGAIPILNKKGEISMQKVKVHRYVSGKRPDYAPASSSDEESEEGDFIEQHRQVRPPLSPQPTEGKELTEAEREDPRMRRLQRREEEEEESEDEDEDRLVRHRHIHAPEILEFKEDTEEEAESERRHEEEEESDSEEELSDEEIERRRLHMKAQAQERTEQSVEEELMDKEEEMKSGDETDEESSEYGEYTDSEEDTGPRLKPVFVRKKDRLTVIEKEREILKQRQMEAELKKFAEEKRKQTLKMVEDMVRKDNMQHDTDNDLQGMYDVNTDDENDEVEYEAWKLRELKRIKRDRDEREQLEKERLDIERVRNMTDEERRLEARNQPRMITNKAAKGKYKFLQKYYHRGAFFMNADDDLYKRDFSAATLEDHFDKTILPKVMQVKNFGRSGRTKYTHLVDQDTTQFDSPWISETAQNLKFHNNQAGGMRQTFEKPSVMKRKRK